MLMRQSLSLKLGTAIQPRAKIYDAGCPAIEVDRERGAEFLNKGGCVARAGMRPADGANPPKAQSGGIYANPHGAAQGAMLP